MTAVNLNNLDGIDKEFLKELKNYDKLFMQTAYLENLLNNRSINNIIAMINDYCKVKQIIGYHYTRANPEDILNGGLTCRKGNDIRRNFISTYGNRFTEDEKVKIKKAWDNHFDSHQQQFRDNLLFFNFTTTALYDLGADPLLFNYGGEQVYMPIQSLGEIGKKVKNIGTPMILKCTLNPNDI